MSKITPTYLAKFTHLVPVGAVIPAGTEYVVGRAAGFSLVTLAYDYAADNPFTSRWTAEPIAAPKQSLAERARDVAKTSRNYSHMAFSNLALIVAELAEMIERGES